MLTLRGNCGTRWAGQNEFEGFSLGFNTVTVAPLVGVVAVWS